MRKNTSWYITYNSKDFGKSSSLLWVLSEVSMMNEIKEQVIGLRNKDNTYAYQCLQQLESESSSSDAVYPYFDHFSEMLGDTNSYIRTRGILLIAANTKWDKDNKIDEIIDDYLKHIMDDKPITARQCIKALPAIAQYKPD